MADARDDWSSDTVLNEATWYSAQRAAGLSHTRPLPPQARGNPLEPNQFFSSDALIDDARITYSSSGRNLRDRERVLAGYNRENKS